MKLEDLEKLNLGDETFGVLQAQSELGHIKVFSAPGNNLIVPSCKVISHTSPLPFIHLHKQVCPLQACKAKKSKQHSLAKKDDVLCIHVLLGRPMNFEIESIHIKKNNL